MIKGPLRPGLLVTAITDMSSILTLALIYDIIIDRRLDDTPSFLNLCYTLNIVNKTNIRTTDRYVHM